LRTEASRTKLPHAGRGDGFVAALANHQPLQTGERLDLRLSTHQGPASVLASSTAQNSHQPVPLAAGLPSIGWHTVSAWGKEAGLEPEDVNTLLRHEDIATTPNVYGDLGMDAQRRIQQPWTKPQKAKRPGCKPTCYHSGTLRDPYLTQIRFVDSPDVRQKNGSSGRTRTYNPPVNSCRTANFCRRLRLAVYAAK
jgi:hypothetical protein